MLVVVPCGTQALSELVQQASTSRSPSGFDRNRPKQVVFLLLQPDTQTLNKGSFFRLAYQWRKMPYLLYVGV